ncbi:MAG: carbamate kinase [Candidatus Marinimicrobia bacterium]|nr:carbamate kinase [Candidatus Neomarinimicrobiota bacterium]
MIRTVVIALGGNALSPHSALGTIAEQFAHTRDALRQIMPFVREGYNVAIAHGNGPQVGDELRRVELAAGKVPVLPLGICVAATQGTIGYMVEQSLQNALLDADIHRDVVTFISQVIVDRNDPALAEATKFIGHRFNQADAERLAAQYGWSIAQQEPDIWRRVVPSPQPIRINNARSIRKLVESGSIVITVGGGGIPAFVMENGHFEGVDAVIDKDLAAAVLGAEIGAQDLYILTDVDGVYLNFGTDRQTPIAAMTVSEAQAYLAQGQFPAGTMGPKIEAAIRFLQSGGQRVVITGIGSVTEAMQHRSGTVIENCSQPA